MPDVFVRSRMAGIWILGTLLFDEPAYIRVRSEKTAETELVYPTRLLASAMSQPYYGPQEPEDTINLERFFLAGDFVTGFGYGGSSRRHRSTYRNTKGTVLRGPIRSLGDVRAVPMAEKRKG